MRMMLKRSVFYLFLLINVLPFMLYRIFSVFLRREAVFASFSQMYSLWPGKVGEYMRGAFYYLTLKKCSKDVTITFGTIFPTPDVVVGSYVYIGANSIISQCVIEDDVMLGSNVHVISGKMTHNFDDMETPIRLQGGQATTISIGRDTWVGNAAVIMGNLGRGCIIGAGSVVTRNVADYTVAAGNPARAIRSRLKAADIQHEQTV